MAYTRTFAQLQSEVAAIGELENSPDMDTVLPSFVNSALLETRELLVAAWEDYYTTSDTIALEEGATDYALPTDFQALRKVEVLEGDEWTRLRSFDLTASGSLGVQPVEPRRCRYRLQAGEIVLAPPPAADTTLRVWYVPTLSELEVAEDVYTFRVPLEHKLVLQVARRDCLDRQELDTSPADRAIARLAPMVVRAAGNRNVDEPFYLDPRGAPRDVYDDSDDYEEWG